MTRFHHLAAQRNLFQSFVLQVNIDVGDCGENIIQLLSCRIMPDPSASFAFISTRQVIKIVLKNRHTSIPTATCVKVHLLLLIPTEVGTTYRTEVIAPPETCGPFGERSSIQQLSTSTPIQSSQLYNHRLPKNPLCLALTYIYITITVLQLPLYINLTCLSMQLLCLNLRLFV